MGVSTTTNPVTQVAEVAVKSAFKNEVLLPGAVDIGNKRKKVPMPIIIKKVVATVKGGEK